MSVYGPPLYEFDLLDLQPFEIGAWLTAIIAFPSPDDALNRQKGVEALCSAVISATCAEFPDDASGWRARFPAYTRMTKRVREAWIKKTAKNHDRTMLATKIASPFFFEDISGEQTLLPKGVTKLTLDKLTEFVIPQSKEKYQDNLETRTWRPCRPVIHIAMALQMVHAENLPMGNSIGFEIQDFDFLKRVIILANLLETIVLGDSRFGMKSENLVRVRLKNDAEVNS